MISICERLGFDTYHPNRDVGKQVFYTNIHSLEHAELLVANLDGYYIDPVTVWALGYGVARGKAAIGIRTDILSLKSVSTINVMITESTFIVKSLPDLEVAIRSFKAASDARPVRKSR